MRRSKSRPQTAYQKAEAELFAEFCKSLRCKQRDFPGGLRELVGGFEWSTHFDALTHKQTEDKLDRLLQKLYAARNLEAKLHSHVEEVILNGLEENAKDQQEAEDWY